MVLINCGTKCIPKLYKTECIITGINIRYEKVIYELSYFNNGSYTAIWLNEDEFETVEVNSTTKIGFK